MANQEEQPAQSDTGKDQREIISPAAREIAPNEGGVQSFGRFLYNNNPFYLISCLLVIYGCQSLAVSSGDVIEKSIRMAGGIASYAVLMALISVAVVRFAKVWEDARSILIVVLISLVAVTTGFDELCIAQQPVAKMFAAATAVLVIVLVEAVLWLCKIRLDIWYRLALYVHYAVLIGFPLLLGDAVAKRNDPLANWGSILFSTSIALGLLLLVPALRRGSNSISHSGTPWSWPLFPVSAFLVLIVLAGIRSHAIWMSFGFYGQAGKFEPFLLLPIVAAVLVMVAETGLGQGKRPLQQFALFGTPVLILCSATNQGATWLPIGDEIQALFGSSLTVCLATMLLVYGWMALRGVEHAAFGLPTTLVVMGIAAPIPETASQFGVDHWVFPMLASLILIAMTLRRWDRDWLWTLAASTLVMAIAMLGQSIGRDVAGYVVATGFAIVSMLIIGATFSTKLAIALRYCAAALMSACLVAISIRSIWLSENRYVLIAAAIAIVSLAYGLLIRRRDWLWLAAAQLILFVATIGYQGHQTGRLRRINWPIASGLVCLCIGVAITTGKTGLYHRLAARKSDRRHSEFLPGL